MAGIKCLICMILILIFAFIHLAVSISIIGRFQRYGNVFRPEIGLASFNIVISVYAVFIGGLGLFAVLVNQNILSKIVGFATIVLVIFTLASLITALAINSLAMNYVNSRFLDHVNTYQSNQDSRNIIDKIQTHYDCCGSSTWLDWSGVLSTTAQTSTISTTAPSNATTTSTIASNATANSTAASTQSTTTTTQVNTTTLQGTTTNGQGTTTNGQGTTTTAQGTTTTAQGTTTTAQDTTATAQATTTTAQDTTTTTSITAANDVVSNNGGASTSRIIDKRDISDNTIKIDGINQPLWEEITGDLNTQGSASEQIIRRKRQTQSNNGDPYGLPSSFNVTLPQSCCTTDFSTINSQSNQYCISNKNSFHTDGCERQLGKHSVDQTIALAVINSCLFILSLAAIALLLTGNPATNPSQNQNGFVNQPIQQGPGPYGGYNTAPGYPGVPYNNYNYNPVYGQYF